MAVFRKGSPRPQFRSDTSEATVGIVLPDVQPDRINEFSTRNLEAIRERLSGFRVEVDDGVNFNFAGFIRRMRGTNILNVDGMKFILLRTRNTYFAMTTVSPETMHDRIPGLMDVDFKKRVILEKDGKKMYLSVLSQESLDKLSLLAERQEQPSSRSFSFRNAIDLRGKLLRSESDTIDCGEFACGVKFVTIEFFDENDRPYRTIIHGKSEDAYRIYCTSEKIPGSHEINCKGAIARIVKEN